MGQEKRNETHRQAIGAGQVKQIQELAETIRYGTITSAGRTHHKQMTIPMRQQYK